MVVQVRLDQPDAGVCVVRAEVQGDHLLISVSTSSGTGPRTEGAPAEATRHFVEVEEAVAVVRQFLEGFAKES